MNSNNFQVGQKVTVDGREATVRQAGTGWVHVRWEDTRFSNSVRTDDGKDRVKAA